MNILFVCTGNTCRSPMAAHLFNKIACQRNLDVKIESAGIYAVVAVPATKQAIEVMKGYGADISEHWSRQLSRELVESSDLILTMTQNHKDTIAPMAGEKVQTLYEFTGGSGDVMDPYGGGIPVYEACAEELYNLLLKVADKIADCSDDKGGCP